GESKSLMDLFNSNETIETSKGYVFGFNTGIAHFNQEQNAICADIHVADYGHLPIVLQELLAKADVKSEIRVPGRAGDFSMRSWYKFAGGRLLDSESQNFYDNGILDSNEETFIESCAKKFGVDLDKITYDDPEVFAAFQDQDIMKWSFVYSCRDGEKDPMAVLKPKSMNDLMVYFAAVMRADDNDGMDAVKEYVDRRDGLKPVPENLPEDLKKTYGMVFFLEQEKFLKQDEWSVPQPMPIMAAKLSSQSTYQFVYLCVKYGVHKDLK
ncbi:MAG: hypothetical protein MJZ57_09570, partial [Bacteroidales bacterium]|nr:hypothetical protein [Bacteroidales bacterium]